MPSIGNDLAAIRKHLGMSLEHIHQLTKIPVLTLKRIENNSIFTDQDENETYIRSFVRSYAKAMKIDLEVAIKALDQQDAGSYTNLLIQQFPELARKKGVTKEQRQAGEDTSTTSEGVQREVPDSEADDHGASSGQREGHGASAEGGQKKVQGSEAGGGRSPEDALKSGQPGKEEPEGKQANEAAGQGSANSEEHKSADTGQTGQARQSEPATPVTDPADDQKQARIEATDSVPSEKMGDEPVPDVESDLKSGKSGHDVSESPPTVNSVNWAAMGHKFRRMDNKTPAWVIALVVIIVLVLATLLLVYQESIFNSFADSAESETTTLADEALPSAADLEFQLQSDTPASLQEEPATEPVPDPVVALGDTLQVTVLAAYGRLEPVRVWSDLKPVMNPYWMSQRTAYHFQFIDTLRIRGQYSRMQLFLNGHRIDDFRESYYNSEEEAVEITRSMFTGGRNWGETVPLELMDDTPAPTVIQYPPLF